MNTGLKFKFVSSFSLIATALSIFSYPAQAVTNGSLVSNPKDDAPYVVSIWSSKSSDDYKDAEFVCTGTLIAPQIVLTAAHCTTNTTPYFVKVGAGALNDKTGFTAVSGIWKSAKYDPRTYVHDIGLFKLVDRFENITFPTLANSITAKKINKFSSLKIFGWGLDQNEDFADLLRTSSLSIQDASAVKTFSKSFNPKTMISAGRKLASDNLWSGACLGDSGGPLISNIDGINVLVGITSWGSKFCKPNKPSIFSRVSFFENEIKKEGIKAVEAQSVVVNRTAPIATDEPELTPANPIPGNSLKCNPGKWKNAVSIRTTWISPARLLGTTNSEVSVLASDGGSIFKCEIIISGANASVRRVLTASIIGSAALSSSPAIAGVSSGATFKSGQIARCEGWNWKTPVDSEKVTWFTSSTSQPSVPVNGRQIGSGPSLTLDSNILKDENGRYLICQVTGVKNGFESHFTASKFITTPSAPVISSVSLSASSLTSGSTATCSFSSSSENESTRVDWGYTSVPGYFTQYFGLSGERIQLTRDLAQQAAGKYLACRVTLSNSGGEVSKSANTYNTFASLPNAPIVSAYISGSVVAGSTARCSTSSGYDYGSTLTYAWGKTTFNGSRLIEGEVYSRSTSYTLTSSSLDNLAGAYLTCVVTLENDAGSVSSASSISMPNNKTIVPQPTSPSVEAQTASSASISVKIRVPSISGYDSSKMVAKLNVINAPNCTNLSVTPGSAYDCSGLSANTAYTANVSVASTSGLIVTNTSSNISFTTIGLNSSLYVCGQSCTGALSSSAMQYYISDKRLIEANAARGGPITSSTCTGSGCNPGTAPVLPVACATGSSEQTNVTANATAQITTHFRYCSAPTDTTPPVISSGTLARTGYAPIIPTSGAAGASISVRFIATDNIGIASTSVRLINPENVVVATSSGSFIAGGVDDGVYSATIATAASGPLSGNIYQIQVQARDASGNSSAWFNLGTYAIASQVLLPTFGAPQISSVATTYVVVIQPARPSNWLSSYEVITEVYSSDERTRIGAASEGSYYSPGSTQSVSANNPGDIAPGNIYKVRFALRDTLSNSYTYGPFTTFTTSAAPVTNQLQIIANGPDSDGITNIGVCFTNPAALSGNVTYNISGGSSGSFLKHSGTPACPSFASGSSGLRLTPDTTYNYSATASNNGINYSATLTHRTPTPTKKATDLYITSDQNFRAGQSYPARAALAQFSGPIAGATINFYINGATFSAVTDSGGIAIYNYSTRSTDTTLSIYAIYGGSSLLLGSTAATRTISYIAPVSSAPTQYQGTDAYSGIVPPGSQQFWELGFQNAVSVSVIATSPGEASIVAPFSPNPGQNVVAAVADGMLPGQKLFKVAIAVPTNAPRNKLFTLTWTATSSSGQTLVVTGGSFNTGP